MSNLEMAMAAVNGLLGLLGWSLKAQHGDLMKRIERLESEKANTQERLVKVETKQDTQIELLKDLKKEIGFIREKVESRP